MKNNLVTCIALLLIIAHCVYSNTLHKGGPISEKHQKQNKKYAISNDILYQGSDKQSHYFLSRVTNKWAIIAINKNELSMADERPYNSSFNHRGYYRVDPNNYSKIREFK
jgi:hypothetical protein